MQPEPCPYRPTSCPPSSDLPCRLCTTLSHTQTSHGRRGSLLHKWKSETPLHVTGENIRASNTAEDSQRGTGGCAQHHRRGLRMVCGPTAATLQNRRRLLCRWSGPRFLSHQRELDSDSPAATEYGSSGDDFQSLPTIWWGRSATPGS